MGEVTKPHGLKGEVAVHLFTEDVKRFDAGAVLLMKGPQSSETKITVATSRPDRGRMLVRFEGIEDRDAAEAIRGSLVFVSSSELASLDEDSFWEHELIGARVVDRDENQIGTITRVLPRFEQDLWEVDSGVGREVLIPASKQIVVSVDLEHKIVVIDPPEGLLNDDAV